MKKLLFLAISLVMIFSSQAMATGSGYDDLVDSLNQVAIDSVDAMQIGADAFYVLVTLSNNSDKIFKFKNGHFDLVINPDCEGLNSNEFRKLNKEYPYPKEKELTIADQMLKLSATDLTEKLLLGKTTLAVNAKQKDPEVTLAENLDEFKLAPHQIRKLIFRVELPADDLGKIEKFQIYNYLCFPPAVKKMAMVGDATVGLKIDRGWIYQKIDLMELHSRPAGVGTIPVTP